MSPDGDPGTREVVKTHDVDAGASAGSSDVHDEVVDSSDVDCRRRSPRTRPGEVADDADRSTPLRTGTLLPTAVEAERAEAPAPRRRERQQQQGSTDADDAVCAHRPTSSCAAPGHDLIVVCGAKQRSALLHPGAAVPPMWRACPRDKSLPRARIAADAPLRGEHSATCDAREVARSQQQSVPLPTPTPPPTTTANETAATPAPAPTSAPPPAQVHAVRSGVTSTGRPILPPLSPLTSPYNSDDWLEHHQQWQLRQRAERERVTGIREERYCWEDPNFLYGWDTARHDTAHCTKFGAKPNDAASSALPRTMAEFQGNRISEMKDPGCWRLCHIQTSGCMATERRTDEQREQQQIVLDYVTDGGCDVSWLEARVSYCRLRPTAASHAASTHAPACVRTHSTLGLTGIANDQSLRFLSFMHSPPRCSHHPRISRHTRRLSFSSSGFPPFSWPAVLSFFLLRVASAAPSFCLLRIAPRATPALRRLLFLSACFALRRAPRLPASKNTHASARTDD